jgi:predicted kinase
VPIVIVVAGIPGSGKTTHARELAPALGMPLVSKDVIKEALLDVLGTGSAEWAATLGRAAHRTMYAQVRDLVAGVGGVILEAHFARGVAEEELLALGAPLVQVYCRCPVEVAWTRYRERSLDPQRHPGHLSEHQDDLATAHWRESSPQPLALAAPLLEVDTSGATVRIDEVAAAVRDLVSNAGWCG